MLTCELLSENGVDREPDLSRLGLDDMPWLDDMACPDSKSREASL